MKKYVWVKNDDRSTLLRLQKGYVDVVVPHVLDFGEDRVGYVSKLLDELQENYLLTEEQVEAWGYSLDKYSKREPQTPDKYTPSDTEWLDLSDTSIGTDTLPSAGITSAKINTVTANGTSLDLSDTPKGKGKRLPDRFKEGLSKGVVVIPVKGSPVSTSQNTIAFGDAAEPLYNPR